MEAEEALTETEELVGCCVESAGQPLHRLEHSQALASLSRKTQIAFFVRLARHQAHRRHRAHLLLRRGPFPVAAAVAGLPLLQPQSEFHSVEKAQGQPADKTMPQKHRSLLQLRTSRRLLFSQARGSAQHRSWCPLGHSTLHQLHRTAAAAAARAEVQYFLACH